MARPEGVTARVEHKVAHIAKGVFYPPLRKRPNDKTGHSMLPYIDELGHAPWYG